jgi:hypothetical protein
VRGASAIASRSRAASARHMAHPAGFHARGLDTALFLRAERQPDGRRTFKLVAREPLPTSYGEDSYRRIFSTGQAAAAVADTSR